MPSDGCQIRNDKGDFVPRLCASKPRLIDRSPLTIRITYKQSARWSDGKPVTAKDVVTTYTIGRMEGFAIWNYIDKVEAAARAADVAEQELEDRGAADHLDAGGVLRPADRVDQRRGPLAARVADQRLGDLQELLARDAADLLDGLGRVARVVPPQDLEHAARVPERLIAPRYGLPQAADHRFERLAPVGLVLRIHPARTRQLLASLNS